VWKSEEDQTRFDASVLIALIKATVAPESWGGNEGKTGSIKALDARRMLLIGHTSANHEKIQKLLESLREVEAQGGDEQLQHDRSR
jgi:hypothetical protein